MSSYGFNKMILTAYIYNKDLLKVTLKLFHAINSLIQVEVNFEKVIYLVWFHAFVQFGEKLDKR